jgi:hypothetical protein
MELNEQFLRKVKREKQSSETYSACFIRLASLLLF